MKALVALAVVLLALAGGGENVGTPEYVPGQDSPKKKGERVMAPYGWHQGDGFLIVHHRRWR